MNTLKFNNLKKLNTKNNILIVQIFFNLKKQFPRRGKVGPLRKRKRVLSWSIYIISLWSRFPKPTGINYLPVDL